MADIVGRLNLARIINATGTVTRLGGSVMDAEVAAAMSAAAQSSADIGELQGYASEIIAECTGAEAGIVTSGAMAGLLLGSAACIAGFDASKMAKLPDTDGMRNEFIVARSHRNSYDHGVRAAGARLVEVGLPDRSTACGVRDTETWEIESAIGERTAGILYLAGVNSRPTLAEVVRAAHASGIPVLVDAAAQLPPRQNLRQFIDAGADLVAFSGGKGIGGPSASGILCGSRRLVASALLQQLDLDYLYEDWQPPAQLIDKREFRGVPRHGVGRACKVGKEQIAGLLTALVRFNADDDAARNRRFSLICTALIESLRGLSSLDARIVPDPAHAGLPLVQIRIVPHAGAQRSASAVAAALRSAPRPIHVDTTDADTGILILAPTCLKIEDAAVIGSAFAAAVSAS